MDIDFTRVMAFRPNDGLFDHSARYTGNLPRREGLVDNFTDRWKRWTNRRSLQDQQHKGEPSLIRHTVIFTLKHRQGSAEEKKFLEDALVLTQIPTVQSFERLKQVSAKNAFMFGLSMEFKDQAAYDAYNDHPIHVAFVRDRWKTEVSDFMEIDYVKI